MLERNEALGLLGPAMALVLSGAILAGDFTTGAWASDTAHSIEYRRAIPLGSVRNLPRWSTTLERHRRAVRREARDCVLGKGAPCRPSAWRTHLDVLRTVERGKLVQAVNDLVNQVPYREDIDAYGVADYWAAPGEFFARGGDCEDYVIAKYLLLRALGVPAGSMRMVAVWDKHARIAHAVLVVTEKGRRAVLDNAAPAPANGRYRPLYSFNERKMWVHARPGS